MDTRDIKIFKKQIKVRRPLYEKMLNELAPGVKIDLDFNLDDEAWSRHESATKSTLHIGGGICVLFITGSKKKVSTATMRWALDEMFGHEFMHTLVTYAYLCPWNRSYESSIKHVFHNALEDPYIEVFARFNKKHFNLYQRREARKLMKWSLKLSAPYFYYNVKQYVDNDDFSSFLNYMLVNRTLNFRKATSNKYGVKITNKFYNKYLKENQEFEEMFYKEHTGLERFKIVDNWFHFIKSTKYFDFAPITFMDFLLALIDSIFGKGSDKGEGLKQIIKDEKAKKENDPDYDPLDDESSSEPPLKYEASPNNSIDFEDDDEVNDSESSIQPDLDQLEEEDLIDSKLDEELESITGGYEGHVVVYD